MTRISLCIFLIFETFFIFISSILNVNVLLVIVLNIWAVLFIYYTFRIKNNIVIWCFLVAFFVFLLGREMCFGYFGLKRYYLYLEKENTFTYFCLSLSLIGIAVGSYLASGKIHFTFGNISNNSTDVQQANYDISIRNICKYAFIFCYIFSLISVAFQIIFVRRVGYVESYVSDSGESGVPSFVSYIAAFTNIALCLYLASRPAKKECSRILFFYELYAILTLFAGPRYPFIGISLFILIYYVIRQNLDGGWIKRRNLILLCIAAPILILVMQMAGSLRSGEQFSYGGVLRTVEDFLDSQGGSVNVIKRVRYFSNQIKDLNFTSFSTLYSNIFENLLMRRLFGVVAYTGNSIEHAMKGHSLMHRLSYYTYGSGYLNGRGVGSCYIAELYHDFGYVGVVLGSVLYGALMKKIGKLKLNRYMHDGILLSFVYALLVAPRADFDTFIAGIINLYSIIGILIILFLSSLSRYKMEKHAMSILKMK